MLSGIAYVWGAYLDYGPLVRKEDAKARETVLSESLLMLADCVDNPKYDQGSDKATRNPSCRERVLEAFHKNKNQ